MSQLSRLAIASTIVLLSACGDKEPAAPAAAESRPAPKEAKATTGELAKLVPADTVIYVEAPSVERLATSMRNITSAFDPSKAAMDIDAAIDELDLPAPAKLIDRTKPLAICLVLPTAPGGQPAPVYFLPARSPQDFVKAVTESGQPFGTAIHGDYVAVTMGPGAAPAPAGAPPSIALELPPGDVVVRLDVQRLVAHYRPVIDASLDQMTAGIASLTAAMEPQTPGMNIAPFLKMYADGLRSVLDSGKTLDLAMRLDGSVLEVASVLVVQEKSALDGFASSTKTDAKALARYIDPSMPIAMVLGMDQAAMMQRLQPLIDATFSIYPEPMRSNFKKMMEHTDELAAQLGSAMCVQGALADDGLRYAVYLMPRDGEKLLETYQKMLSSAPGMTLDPMQAGEVAGVKVQRSRLRIDPKALVGEAPAASTEEMGAMIERLYGKDGLAFTLAKQDDVTALVLGGDEQFLATSLARLSKPGSVPPSFARGLEQVGDLNPCFVMHYDLGAMMQGVRQLMPEMPFPFPSMNASFTVHGGVDGRIFRGAMSTDIAALGQSFREMMSGGGAPIALGAKAQADLVAITAALEAYAVSNGQYPESLAVLAVPDESGDAYIPGGSLPKDPWGRDYLYEPPGAGRETARVYTLGRDGQPGGTGEDADVEGPRN